MCVAVPGRVVGIDEGSKAATVAFGTVERRVDLTLTPEVSVGDWVITHSGFALRRISAEAAADINNVLAEGVPPVSRTP
jgi:hydrogenase expression/formation protein HypC